MQRLGRTPLPLAQVRGMVGEGLERLLEKAVGADLVADGVKLFRERYAQVADEKTRVMPDRRSAGGARVRGASCRSRPTSRDSSRSDSRGRWASPPASPASESRTRHPPETGTPRCSAPHGRRGRVGGRDRRHRRLEIDAEFARSAGCRVVLVAAGSRSEPSSWASTRTRSSRGSRMLPRWVGRALASAPSESADEPGRRRRRALARGPRVLRRAGHEVVELVGRRVSACCRSSRPPTRFLVRSRTKSTRRSSRPLPGFRSSPRAGVRSGQRRRRAAPPRVWFSSSTHRHATCLGRRAHVSRCCSRCSVAVRSLTVALRGKWEKSRFMAASSRARRSASSASVQVGSRVAARPGTSSSPRRHDPYFRSRRRGDGCRSSP